MATAQKVFEYTVRDHGGKVSKGRIEATSQAAVVNRLRTMGVAPLAVTEISTSGLNSEIKIPGFSDRVALKDLAIFARQFATMINSGLSILRSLTILAEQTENKTLAGIVTQVRGDVEAGTALSAALGKHPQVFPPLMINMIRAGEVGGFLDGVLLSVAENFESEVKLRGKVKSAMTYPVVVFIIAILAVVGMLLFIVPIFAKMFSDLGGELPWPTQILVTMSQAMKIGGPVLVVALFLGSIWWTKNRHKQKVRNVVDPMKLRMPIFGKLFQKIAVARFSRNFGTMIHSGVPILQALSIVGATSGNVVIERATDDIQDAVRSGEAITSPLSKHSVFPPMVTQMMAVGEDTGALDAMLGKIADFYDQEVEATTDALTSLIEPLMIAVLGGIIGSMIIALYMPIFNIFNLIK
ncbi:MAG: type II secretion system F family protein [Actinomycetales bacterium]|nr:type II secretion system F family protein [Actinomycetales bacterium]